MRPLRDIRRPDLRDDLDLRAWRVLASDGTPLGVVAEVILDDAEARPIVVNDAALLGRGTATLGRLVDRASGPG